MNKYTLYMRNMRLRDATIQHLDVVRNKLNRLNEKFRELQKDPSHKNWHYSQTILLDEMKKRKSEFNRLRDRITTLSAAIVAMNETDPLLVNNNPWCRK